MRWTLVCSSLSRRVSARANSFVGTAQYVSPELLTEKSACKRFYMRTHGVAQQELLKPHPNRLSEDTSPQLGAWNYGQRGCGKAADVWTKHLHTSPWATSSDRR
ncbi:hypothetical protein H8959_010154 [Pygathrix nigripes]